MAAITTQPILEQVERPLNVIPVGLKEAALDSPTFRATAVHFSDQIEVLERWLESYVKSTSRLVHEVSSLEDLVNSFLSKSVPPPNLSEAVLDPDYTLLAMKRYGEGAREFWSHTISGMKKMEAMVVEPIRGFLYGELRNFKDARRYLDQTQKSFDSLLSRFSGQSKHKEASALREDAFQLHESRKAYIKASMDFCVLAPQLRTNLDKLLVRLFTNQWSEMRRSRERATSSVDKWGSEMDRVKGWSRELEAGERVLKRELQNARRKIEEGAETRARPPRDLDYYSLSTVPFLGAKGPAGAFASKTGPVAEKQSWLFERTLTGKPARTVWVRRWFYVKNGIFGWLIQGQRSGGVEESERTGVLLCNVKPAYQEERRFCFEVKTKDTAITLQAETQIELTEWIAAFEAAKRKALESTTSGDPSVRGSRASGAAFAISPPVAPEFAAKFGDGHFNDDLPSATFDRSATLPVPDGSVVSRSSFDITSSRRPTGNEKEGEGAREHAARIIQKLDLHRKSNAGSAGSPGHGPPSAGLPSPAGGIAGLISSSHSILPVYSTPAVGQPTPGIAHRPTLTDMAQIPGGSQTLREPPPSSLAPSTLANPPAATNLSKAAVVVSGERGVTIGEDDMPGGLMANQWGSNDWGYINRLERGDVKPLPQPLPSNSPSPRSIPIDSASKDGRESPRSTSSGGDILGISPGAPTRRQSSPGGHRQTISLSDDSARAMMSQITKSTPESFPSNYPIQLKTQEAQFRMLFPHVSREEKLVLVFRATWSPDDKLEFPGRIYVSPSAVYFYSHHLGLILISSLSLGSIDEVAGAPGKDCDFLFIHLKDGASEAGYTRVTIKIFLENLKLLQRRLNYLIRNFNATEPLDLGSLLSELIKIETDLDKIRSPSLESWDDMSPGTPAGGNFPDSENRSEQRGQDLRTKLIVDKHLHGSPARRVDKDVTKFRLPAEPIAYEPKIYDKLAVSKDFDISPKALFHVIFGDKSAVFQLLYRERLAKHVRQDPWITQDDGKIRREFEYDVTYYNRFRQLSQAKVLDSQTIDILNDHLCYSIIDRKTPWHLPFRHDFALVTYIVITHLAKSKCRLNIFISVSWTSRTMLASMITQRALADLSLDALDLADVCTDQVRRLGSHSRTRKAIQIFGHVGQLTSPYPFNINSGSPTSPTSRIALTRRTLTSLLLENMISFLETSLTSTGYILFNVMRAVCKQLSAQRMLVLALLLSLALNASLQTATMATWWRDRRATSFMSRLGVGPDAVMGKAIFVNDLNSLVTNLSAPAWPTNTLPGVNFTSMESACYTTFASLTSANPDQVEPVRPARRAVASSARRLQKTRTRLAEYRHDLIVAMRVIQSVEREVIRGAWEEWVMSEWGRCKAVEGLIETSEMKEWWEDYCVSCGTAFKTLAEKRA